MPLAFPQRNGKPAHYSSIHRAMHRQHLSFSQNFMGAPATSQHSFASGPNPAPLQAMKSPNCSTCKPSARQPVSAGDAIKGDRHAFLETAFTGGSAAEKAGTARSGSQSSFTEGWWAPSPGQKTLG